MAHALPDTRSASPSRSAAQTRVLDAALNLFGRFGVSGTSLQMIADALHVTKAAIYRQFKTKEAIVIALTERELAGLESSVELVEKVSCRTCARELLVDAVIDIAIARRQHIRMLQFDPVIVRLLAEHEPFRHFMSRLYAVLVNESSIQDKVPTAMLSGAIAVGVTHPLVADIDNDALRTQLKSTIRQLFFGSAIRAHELCSCSPAAICDY